MSPEIAQAIASFLIDNIQNEHQITLKVLRAVPEGKLDWRPHQKGKSARELAWHVALSDVWFLGGIAAGQFPMEAEPQPPEHIAEIVSFYETRFPEVLARLSAITPEAFAKTLDFAGVFSFPAFAYLSMCMAHTIHHRGQLSTYLRAMGEKVPGIYGGSADEPWVPPAEAKA